MTQITNTITGGVSQSLQAVHVDALADRFGSALRFLNGQFDCKLSGRDTGGALCIYDTIRSARGGPPMHIHHEQDEWFYVRDGEFIVQVGDARFHLGPGDALLAPRKVPHAFANVSEKGRLIVAFQPAGSIERLFSEIAELSRFRLPTLEDWQAVSCTKGVDIVGPPLKL